MGTLTDKLGENLEKVRSAAEAAFLSCSNHKEFGIKLATSFLTNDSPVDTRPKAKGGKKPTLSTKQVSAKYQMLHKMLLNF